MPNKTKIVVLVGVICLALCAFNLPVLTYAQSDSSGTAQMQILGKVNIIPAGLILLLMLLRWKWRGVLWIIVSLAGALLTPFYAQTLYSIQSEVAAANVSLGNTAFGIGLLAIIASYLVILAGSIWDVREERQI